ncbi:DUF2938 family protein [Frigidibacter sp. MR17.14]|uniref:DUF2938 family protein n=1 Tax=Frigidibacter sp. MR17.14 TaxID=3126509 RepID=UPI0030131CD7
MLLPILFIGIATTAVFDLWGLIVAKALGLPVQNWKMPGRWFAHIGRGRLRHDSMAGADEVPGEQALGWLCHYLVGICFAAFTVFVGGPAWLAVPTLPLPLIVGIVTVGLGWFVMGPCMGGGIAASKAANPTLARALSLAAHVVFGLALWVFALIWASFAA